MKTHTILWGGLVSGCLAVTSPAYAQQTWIHDHDGTPVLVTWGQGELPNRADFNQPFERLDRNGDGRLKKSELPAGHALRFEWKLVDTNGDGVITRREYQRWSR